MTDSRHSDEGTRPLTDELARRVLSRAVELDVTSRSDSTVQQLRAVAQELGIADELFDRALAELRSQVPPPPRSTVRRLWNALRAGPRSAELTVVANVATFGVFWAALGAVSWVSGISGMGWEIDAALRIAVNVAGVSLARHVRARPVGFVLATTAIAQLAEYAIHLVYGLPSAQGTATHFAVLLAAALGVAIASWEHRDAMPPIAQRVEDAPPAGEVSPDRLPTAQHLRAHPLIGGLRFR